MKKLFVLFLLLSSVVFAEWELDYSQAENDNNSYITISTVNTNNGSAWLRLATAGEGFYVYMQFANFTYTKNNLKVSYKIDSKKAKVITAIEEIEGEYEIFSSARNHDSTIAFVSELLEAKKLSITVYDDSNKKHVYQFDVQGLPEHVTEAYEYYGK